MRHSWQYRHLIIPMNGLVHGFLLFAAASWRSRAPVRDLPSRLAPDRHRAQGNVRHARLFRNLFENAGIPLLTFTQIGLLQNSCCNGFQDYTKSYCQVGHAGGKGRASNFLYGLQVEPFHKILGIPSRGFAFLGQALGVAILTRRSPRLTETALSRRLHARRLIRSDRHGQVRFGGQAGRVNY